MTVYDDTFYDNQSSGSLRSAKQVVPILIEKYSPKTVIDVGCGVGAWSSVFEELGCEAYGIDGDYVSRDKIVINNFIPMDISLPFELNSSYDMAVCLEVAEHLPLERSESFVEDLTSLSNRVVFSAATPGQGGTNHINEQPLSFWINLFYNFNYKFTDPIRNEISNNDLIDFWYRNNIVVFERI